MPSNLAFITGASKGIGRATALEAASWGLDVFVTARNEEELKSLSKSVNGIGQKCYYKAADLNISSEVINLVSEVINLKRPISLMVHAAGVAKVGPVNKMSLADWQININTNLTAPFFLTNKLLQLMSEKGHIFFINSVAGKQTFPDWSSYCASKFGLKAFADSFRQEVAPQGIKVTSIYPASVDTPMQDSLPYDWDRSKMLQVDDVARAIIFCYSQPDSVVIKDLEIENNAGIF